MDQEIHQEIDKTDILCLDTLNPNTHHKYKHTDYSKGINTLIDTHTHTHTHTHSPNDTQSGKR